MPLPLLLLLIVATTIGAQSECPGPIGDLRWFQNNAQTLLFMQHLQEKAIVEGSTRLAGSNRHRYLSGASAAVEGFCHSF